MKAFMIKFIKVAGIFLAAVSAFAAWYGAWDAYTEHHSPFGASVSFGTPVFGTNGKIVSVALPVSLSNAGGKPGCVSDLALTLQSKSTRTRYTFFPAFFVDMTKYLRDTPGKVDPFTAIETPSTPLRLLGHEKISKGVLFMPRPPKAPVIPPLQVDQLTPDDTYTFQLFVIPTGANCSLDPVSDYGLTMTAEYHLTPELLEGLKNGKVILPLDEAQNSVREKFLQRP